MAKKAAKNSAAQKPGKLTQAQKQKLPPMPSR